MAKIDPYLKVKGALIGICLVVFFFAFFLHARAVSTFAVQQGGTGTTTAPLGQIFYGGYSATNPDNRAYLSTATTSVTCSGSISCSGFAVIGSSPITISFSGGSGLNWNTATNFGQLVYATSTPTLWFQSGLFASSTSDFDNSSTTLATIGTLWLPPLGTPAGTFLAADPTGKVIATTTPSGGGLSSYDAFTHPILVTNSATTSLMLFNGNASTTQLESGGSAWFATSTGMVSIASSSPWGLLSVNPDALGSGVPEFVVGSSSATHLAVTGGGNVGVGTSSPQTKFVVVGNSVLGDFGSTGGYPLSFNGTAIAGRITVGTSTTFTSVGTPTALFASTAPNPLGLLTNNSNSNAVQQLNQSTVDGTGNGNDFATFDTTSKLIIGARLYAQFTNHTAGSVSANLSFITATSGVRIMPLFLAGNGEVGVLNNNPQQALDVGGNIRVGTTSSTGIAAASNFYAASTTLPGFPGGLFSFFDSNGVGTGGSGGFRWLTSPPGTVSTIAFDASSTAATTAFTTTLTSPITIGSGSNRILVCAAGISGASAVRVASVDLDGVSLTRYSILNGNTEDVGFWYLLNPASGAGNVIFHSDGNSVRLSTDCATFTGVDQTVPFNTAVTSTGSSIGTGVITTPSIVGQWIVGAFAKRSSLTAEQPFTVGYSSQVTLATTTDQANNASATITAMDYTIATTTTTGVAWNWTTNTRGWVDILVPMNPAGMSTANTPIERLSLNQNGNFGVGSSTPFARLSVMVGAEQFLSQAASTVFAVASSSAGTATTTLFNIQSTGNVGLGSTSPAYGLSIDRITGTVATSSVSIGSSADPSCLQLFAPNGTAYRIFVSNAGVLTTVAGSCQ